MQGQSRQSLAEVREGLDAAVGQSGDPATLSQELFAVADLVGREGTLRRSLADPARSGADRGALLSGLLNGQVSAGALALAVAVAGQRWNRPGDVVTALEQLGEEALLVSAEQAGSLERVEDELFRFARVVERESDLALALSNPKLPAAQKSALIHGLLDGKATEQTIALIERVATSRGLPVARALHELTETAAARRSRRIATVTSAAALSSEQVERIASALSASYGHQMQVQVEIDPSIVGGVIVKVGDELIDGSVSRRLDTAARALVR